MWYNGFVKGKFLLEGLKMPAPKTALITGITGQDGSYLAELLLEKGYQVFGIDRRVSERGYSRINHILSKIKILEGDITEFEIMRKIIKDIVPDEIYNLAAQSHVGYSFKMPLSTFDTTGKSVWAMLEIIREVNPKIKFYQASTSELYGGDPGSEPQDETTPFNPHSPYAIAKLAAFHLVKLYRQSYSIFACNGILFNHESPRRGEDFVTRKITLGLAKILAGKQEVIELGNLDAKRDWGFAGDYVEAMWRILQSSAPDDFVIATGKTHTVRDFVEEAFRAAAGIEIGWRGQGIDEVGFDKNNPKKIFVKINPEFFRPSEVKILCGNPAKAKNVLGWEPKTEFGKLVKMMVEADINQVGKE